MILYTNALSASADGLPAMGKTAPLRSRLWCTISGGLGGLDKCRDFGGILFARCRLDARGDVYGIGAHFADGVGHVFWRETAGENDGTAEFARLDGEGPVEGGAGPAELRRRIAVQ